MFDVASAKWPAIGDYGYNQHGRRAGDPPAEILRLYH